jgi:hypothetical protein
MSGAEDWTPELVARKLQALGTVSEKRLDWPLRAAAAVVYEFEPATLHPAGNLFSTFEEAVKPLLADCISKGPGRYLLKPQARREVLFRLRSRDAIATVLAANPRPEDLYQRILSAYVRGDAVPSLENQSIEELRMTRHVFWMVDGLLDNLPSPEAVRRAIDTRGIIDWFAIIAGPDFSGREAELDKIRDFMGLLPPRTRLESARRSIRDFLPPSSVQPLFIRGPGGVGKTALVARFILDRLEDLGKEFPFAYLNFGRPAMRIEQPARVLAEAAGQLGVSFGLPTEVPVDVLVPEFGRALADVGLREQPWLLVMDALEEVQYLGTGDALRVLLASLQANVPGVRIILVSRVKLGGLSTFDLELPEFDSAAADAFLQRRGIENPDLRKSITRTVGRHPLTLNLAAEVIAHGGEDALPILPASFWFRPSNAVIQGALIERIIDHLHDEEVRQLVPAALVLRRLTPELIEAVVAPVRGLPVSDIQAAERIFERFRREVTLTFPAESNSLYFRTDVRRVMLPLLIASEPETVRRMHSAAAAYYARSVSVDDRAEEIYHLLSLDADPSLLASRWQPAAGPYLRASLEELPPAARVWLQTKLGIRAL